MEKFRNKYRIASARAQWWDYGRNGLYFITICTANREHYFGKIVNGKMILSISYYIINNFANWASDNITNYSNEFISKYS
jgi:hypothetical protein